MTRRRAATSSTVNRQPGGGINVTFQPHQPSATYQQRQQVQNGENQSDSVRPLTSETSTNRETAADRPSDPTRARVHFNDHNISDDEGEAFDFSGVPAESPPSTPSSPRTPTPHSRLGPTPCSTPRIPNLTTPWRRGGVQRPPSTPRSAFFGRRPSKKAGSKSGPRAQDIWTFFESKDGLHCCRFCLRRKQEGKPVPFHEYKGKGTDSLRNHLITHHRDAWIAACDELKIKISAKNAKEALWAYREENGDTGTEDNMPHAHRSRDNFTRESFINAIMTLVVGDDQSLNLIENRHFRDLILLLRSDLQDEDIPHIDTLRARILESLDEHLDKLSKEMKIHKIGWLTTDNASNNDTLMAALVRELRRRYPELSINAIDMRISE
ncbi:hypothetical protein EV421DRAFT_1733051 [Armillaria borealis]|uniref:BED-type domain-containing protein n=1 Tax=Armillaria borealis TaxID=47425 RepID=A0AA39MWI1_9AGAR|nr:hypothetical protein EV421DRAFT_1733051 [Armillaria borealis]